jgi:predicted naringenin-chalcone synthase
MILRSIASSFPEEQVSQQECWERMGESGTLEDLRPASVELLRRLLTNDNGIQTRHLAIGDLAHLKSASACTLNRLFEQEAPRLSASALQKALDQAELATGDIDALFICTCTGYLCPGLSSYVAEQLGLSESVYLNDLVGQGCGAAIPMLRAASGYSRQNPSHRIACVAVEVCSTAFYVDDDPGVLVSLALFGDAACATIWDGREKEGYRCEQFDSVHWPQHREALRFANQEGFLRNQLHRSVPATAAKAVGKLFARTNGNPPAHILSHSGGRDVLDALESELGHYSLTEAREVLRQYGNTSSPSVLLALESHLLGSQPSRDLWLVSFGAGFTCHSLRLKYQ